MQYTFEYQLLDAFMLCLWALWKDLDGHYVNQDTGLSGSELTGLLGFCTVPPPCYDPTMVLLNSPALVVD